MQVIAIMAHGCQHGDAAALQLHGAVTPDASHRRPTKIRRDPQNHLVPNGLVVLRSKQRRRDVQRPVAPGLSSVSVLEEHAGDPHHCQSGIDVVRVISGVM